MKKSFKIAVPSIFILLLMQCSGVARYAPDWYKKNSPDDQYIVVNCARRSADLQQAIKEVEAEARGILIKKIDGFAWKVRDELATDADQGDRREELLSFYNVTIAEIVETQMSRLKVAHQQTVKAREYWRAYIQLRFDLGETKAELVRRIRSNREMYSLAKDLHAFKTLEEDFDRAMAQKLN